MSANDLHVEMRHLDGTGGLLDEVVVDAGNQDILEKKFHEYMDFLKAGEVVHLICSEPQQQ